MRDIRINHGNQDFHVGIFALLKKKMLRYFAWEAG
jgi:hypothetical protein